MVVHSCVGNSSPNRKLPLTRMFGIGARYGALLGLAFVVIAFATAHRYWEFPEAAQNLQFAFLSKDLAIAGGLLVLFVTGAGPFSVDNAPSSLTDALGEKSQSNSSRASMGA